MSDDLSPAVRQTAADYATSALRALADRVNEMAPGWGAPFQEIVGHIIPNQREERVALFVTQLARRCRFSAEALTYLTDRVEQLETRADQRLALFEEGMRAAVTTPESERMDGIAQLVADGLSDTELQAQRNRSLLAALNRLDALDLETLRVLATRCAEGRRAAGFAPGRERAVLQDDRGNDAGGYAAFLLTRGNLEGRKLISVPDSTGYRNAYPTTLGEELLYRAGLHPDPSRLYSLSRVTSY